MTQRSRVRSLGLVAVLTASAMAMHCGPGSDNLACSDQGCNFSDDEWTRLQSLANLPETPPDDPSNEFAKNAAAATLGQKFFFDTRFSGSVGGRDNAGRQMPFARGTVGSATSAVSCASCHNGFRAGIDDTSVPGHVSVGTGWFDTNAQATVNTAYNYMWNWSMRTDSLWAVTPPTLENPVAMNGTRMGVYWVLNDRYKAEYNAVFGAKYPFPEIAGASASNPTGAGVTLDANNRQCVLVGGVCPPACRNVANGGGCWPRFPLNGKPGNRAGCQSTDTTEPHGDAWDCMDGPDRVLINRLYANFSKAQAAYQTKLVSRNASFDQWINDGAGGSTAISAAAQRGAKLFVGKASCIDCHSGPMLSDFKPHNIGIPQVGQAGVPSELECPASTLPNPPCDCVNGVKCWPWGFWDGMTRVKSSPWRRDLAFSDTKDNVAGQRPEFYNITFTDDLKGQWRTAPLRNVALTPPYMHNGYFKTLEEVVWHYNTGGLTSGFSGTKSKQIRPLGLTDQEQADLVAFLQTLTGEKISAALATSPVLP